MTHCPPDVVERRQAHRKMRSMPALAKLTVCLTCLVIATAFASAARLLRADDEVEAPRRWCVIVVGLPGDEEHAPLFRETTAAWQEWLTGTLKVAPENLRVVSAAVPKAEADSAPAAASRDELAKTFTELSEKIAPRDSFWLLVLGHGHYDGKRAWLHVPGPDPDAAQFAEWLNKLRCRQQTVWLTQTCSGWWLKPLAKPGRIVITATAAEQEENETEFPHALATLLRRPLADLDLNHDRSVTLAELFRGAVRETSARFEKDKRLPTEHAQLDDDADGLGTEAEQLADENAPRPAVPTAKPASPRERARDGREAANVQLLEVPAP